MGFLSLSKEEQIETLEGINEADDSQLTLHESVMKIFDKSRN